MQTRSFSLLSSTHIFFPLFQVKDVTVPPWATNMDLMSPLLHAYEERIKELEQVAAKSYGLAEQVTALAGENESLREELQQKTDQVAEMTLNGGGGSGDPLFLRTQLTAAPNFFSKLFQIVNQIRNFMLEVGGKHNSKIEISSCFMCFISRFWSCFFGESEI